MIRRLLWWLGGFRTPCRWWGHVRDWPEMEQCCWCGTHMPLEEQSDER